MSAIKILSRREADRKRTDETFKCEEAIQHTKDVLADFATEKKVCLKTKSEKQEEFNSLMAKTQNTLIEKERISALVQTLIKISVKIKFLDTETLKFQELREEISQHLPVDYVPHLTHNNSSRKNKKYTTRKSSELGVVSVKMQDFRPDNEFTETGQTKQKRKNEIKDASPIRNKKMRASDKAS
jgi:hypothetical protein